MKAFLMKIHDKFVAFGHKFVNFFCSVGSFFRHFPKNFVNFWKKFGIGFYNFFRHLPHNTVVFFKTMTKDKAMDLAVGTCATIIWCMPVFVVVYVLTWFLSK